MTGALVRQSREHHRPIHHHMASGMQITIGQTVRLLWQAAEHAHSGRRWMCEGAFWSPLSFRCPEVVGRGWASAGLSLLACRCRNGCHISFDCDRQIGRSTLHSPRFRCPQSRRRPHPGGAPTRAQGAVTAWGRRYPAQPFLLSIPSIPLALGPWQMLFAAPLIP